MPNIILHSVVAVFALLFAAGAQAQIYRCTDANGRPLYTDTKVGKCQLIDTGYSTPSASAPIPAPRSGGGGAAAPASAAPTNFPRVDNAVQRARDDERREILGDELRTEERKLADLKRDFKGGEPDRQGNERNYAKYLERVASMREEISRTERNIEALRREIGNIR